MNTTNPSFKYNEANNIVFLKELTFNNADKLLKDILPFCQKENIKFDLSELLKFDSSTIAVLLEVKKIATKSLVFINTHSQLNEFAKFLKVDGILFE